MRAYPSSVDEMGEDSSSWYQDQTRVCKPLQGVGPVCVWVRGSVLLLRVRFCDGLM